MKIAASFFFLFFSSFLFTEHPIHVSITNIDYSEKSEEFSISIKTFKDDIETIVNTKYKVVLNLGSQNELKDAGLYIDKYINSHFNLNFDGKSTETKLIFQKKEISEDNALWLFYIVKQKKIPKKVKIENIFLNDLYPDQKNLLIFTLRNTQEAITFERSKTKVEFEVEK